MALPTSTGPKTVNGTIIVRDQPEEEMRTDGSNPKTTDQTIIEINMEPTLENILAAMQDVQEALSHKMLRAEQKTDARSKMAWAIKHVKEMSTPATPPLQQYVEVDDEITTIKSDLKEIKEALKSMATKSPRSYAQVAASPISSKPKDVSAYPRLEAGQRERLEQAKMDRAKMEVTLTLRNASEKAYARLRDTSEKDYVTSLQTVINSSTAKGVTIRKLQKLPGRLVKIQCDNENDAMKLRELDWEKAFEGATVVKPEYGIVLDGVPTQIIDARNDTQEQMKRLLEAANMIKVKRVSPLMKNPRNPSAPTQSIIIITECPKDANDAIVDNIRIEGRYYVARRYNPQHQIRQCFRCQGYGHKAETCTRKLTCGRYA